MENFIETQASITMNESLKKAWVSTKANIWLMAGFVLIYYIVSWALQQIPGVSSVLSLVSFILSASLLTAFHTYEQRGKLDFNDFFSWSPRFGRLFLGNLLLLAMVIAIMVPVVIVLMISLGAGFFTSMFSDPEAFMTSLLGGWFIVIMLCLLAFFFVVGVFLFAYPFLVLFTDMPLTEALSKSIRIGRANMGQIFLFFLMAIGIALLGCLALGIGLTVSIAVLTGTQYYFMKSMLPSAGEADRWDFMKQQDDRF